MSETRTRRIIVRVTSGELERIQKNAVKAGLNLSSYARKRMLCQPVECPLPPEFFQTRMVLAGLCNNVNQIARAVHTRARDPTKAAEEALDYARRAYEELSRLSRGV